MLAAPLLAGNDLPNMTPEVRAILTIATSSHRPGPLGHQATRAYSEASSTSGPGIFRAGPRRLPSSTPAPTATPAIRST